MAAIVAHADGMAATVVAVRSCCYCGIIVEYTSLCIDDMWPLSSLTLYMCYSSHGISEYTGDNGMTHLPLHMTRHEKNKYAGTMGLIKMNKINDFMHIGEMFHILKIDGLNGVWLICKPCCNSHNNEKTFRRFMH
ncbi:hypothetical protein ACJX0J_007908, partial [Zea mays]